MGGDLRNAGRRVDQATTTWPVRQARRTRVHGECRSDRRTAPANRRADRPRRTIRIVAAAGACRIRAATLMLRGVSGPLLSGAFLESSLNQPAVDTAPLPL